MPKRPAGKMPEGGSRSRRVKSTVGRIVEDVTNGADALLKRHGSPDELWLRDRDLKGFVLKLRATGRHVYGVHFARARFLNLGGVDRLTAGGARKAAREALAQTALTGAPARAGVKASSTLGAFLDDVYEPWASATLKSASETVARVRVQFRSLLRTPLAAVTPFAVERLRLARLKAGTRRATVNRDVGALKAALNRAVAWGRLKTNPLASVRPYRVDSTAIVRYLSTEQEQRLREALVARDTARRADRESANAWRRARGYDELPAFGPYTDHLTPIVLLALNTGLRRGEIFHLRWRDVNLGRALLTVHGAGAKSGQTRHVPLNTDAVSVLTTWRGDVDRAPEAALVFPSPTDAEAVLEDIKKGWAAVVKAAKVRPFRFHDCRHSFASRLVQAGVDLNTVRELLGHADIKMVIRYAHLAPETKAAAVARLVPSRDL